jgi:hypothetical protein
VLHPPHDAAAARPSPPRKADLAARVKALKEGDWVRLSWRHEAVKYPGVSCGERPVTALEPLTQEEGEALAAKGARPAA